MRKKIRFVADDFENNDNLDIIDTDDVDATDNIDGSDTDVINIDADEVEVIDLRNVDTKEPKKDNDLLNKLGDYVHKKRKRKRTHRKLKHVIAFMLTAVLLMVIGVAIWNSIQMNQAEELIAKIDNTYTMQESGISQVEKLGNLLTIHDSASYNWVIENINMTTSLKRSLFSTDENGEYTFQGTPVSNEIAPKFELIEVQYASTVKTLSYLAVFNVTREDGSVMQYFVTCEFTDNVLTAFHIY